MNEDETAYATLTRIIDLTVTADAYRGGWKQAAMTELDQMRREMPYADILKLTLTCERHV